MKIKFKKCNTVNKCTQKRTTSRAKRAVPYNLVADIMVMLFYKYVFFLIAHNIFIPIVRVQEKVVHSHTESPKGFRNRLIGISRNNNNHLKGHMQRPLSMTIRLIVP